jgi:hypothetical protein
VRGPDVCPSQLYISDIARGSIRTLPIVTITIITVINILYDYSSNDVRRTRSMNQLWVKNINYNNITCNDGDDYHNYRMRTNGERTICYSNQDTYMIPYQNFITVTDALFRLGHFNEGKINTCTIFNNNNSNYWYNNNGNYNNNMVIIMMYDETTSTG